MALMARLLFVAVLLGTGTGQPCGQPVIEPQLSTNFIVGGTEAKSHSWPWMASIHVTSEYGDKEDYGHSCGASLISTRWIITAAHCIDLTYWKLKQYSVVLGAHSSETKISLEEGVRYQVKNIVQHQKWNKDYKYNYDIALIKLDRDVTIDDHVQPVCLPDAGQTYEDRQEFIVTGWGHVFEGGYNSPVLNQVDVPNVKRDYCRDMPGMGPSKVHEGVLCAGHTQGGKDSCQNDSGGPLVAKMGGKWIQAGVVSWGFGCARPFSYAIYTDVGFYRNWIHKTMAEN